MDKFVKSFESKVKKTIDDYELCNKKEKIIVACSGGKDSTVVLYLMKKLGYNAEALMINLRIGEWSKRNLDNIRKFCSKINVKLHVIDIKEEAGSSICYIRHKIQAKQKLTNCMICGVLKRWILNKKSRELGAKKLVTGHNLDDEAENLVMNLFKGKPELSFRLGPKTGILRDAKFVVRIKPLYFMKNSDVKKYSKLMKFPVLYSSCPCAVGVFRKDVREFILDVEKFIPDVKENLVFGFLKNLDYFKKKISKKEELKYCKVCGEPSSGEICKRCELIGILNGKQVI